LLPNVTRKNKTIDSQAGRFGAESNNVGKKIPDDHYYSNNWQVSVEQIRYALGKKYWGCTESDFKPVLKHGYNVATFDHIPRWVSYHEAYEKRTKLEQFKTFLWKYLS
jgi:hypothetical protein